MASSVKTKLLVTCVVLGGVALANGACGPSTSAPPAGAGGSGPPATGDTTGGSVQVGSGGVGLGGSSPIGAGFGGTTPVSPGAGGTTGPVSGAAGTSPGGGGTSGAAVKLCATKTTAASTLIADFENFNGTTTADKYAFAFAGPTNGTAGVYGGPYAYAGAPDVISLAILAGHTGNYGLSLSTMPATAWGQGLGFWMGCVNASAYKGITFWVRGDVPSAVFSFGINTESTTLPDSANPAAGGTCTGTNDTCKPPTKSAIPIGMDWSQITVPWADLVGGLSGGTAVVANGDNITGFTILMALNYAGNEDAGYAPVAGNISFAIDDIAFMP